MAGTGPDAGSMALRAVAATVAIFFRDISGCTAAGITKFPGRRAGIPVAGRSRAVNVFFTTSAGMFGSAVPLIENVVLIIICCAGDWFCHGVSCNFFGYNYSYAHKSFKRSYHTMRDKRKQMR